VAGKFFKKALTKQARKFAPEAGIIRVNTASFNQQMLPAKINFSVNYLPGKQPV
jgi:hypothetical protein